MEVIDGGGGRRWRYVREVEIGEGSRDRERRGRLTKKWELEVGERSGGM